MKDSLIKGQTAFISGASSGIGKACAEHFAALGVHLVVVARRLERLENLAHELTSKYGVIVTPFQLDVRDQLQVDQVAQQLAHRKIQIDILVNNAGLALGGDMLQEGNLENWNVMIDTNIKGVLYLIKMILPSMVQRNAGHIINIGSVAGHGCYPHGNVYCATKFAVRAISQSLRLDLIGTKIRVSEIDPGAVQTEFSDVRFANEKERAKKVYEGYIPLVADDIADAVVYCATRAPHVNISEIIITPQAQASIRDIYRQPVVR